MAKVDELSQIHKEELDMLLEIDRICKKNNLRYYLAYGTVLGAVRHKGFIPWDTDVDIMVDIDNYQRFCNILKNEISEKYFVYSRNTDPTYEELFARVGKKNSKHHKIHIDIFPIAGAPSSTFAKKIFSKIAYLNYRSYFVKKVNVNVNYKNRPNKKRQAIIAKIILLPIPTGFFVWLFKKLSQAYPIEKSSTLCNICGSYGYRELFPKSYLGDPVYMEFEGHEFPVPQEWHKYLEHFYGDYMIPQKKNVIW